MMKPFLSITECKWLFALSACESTCWFAAYVGIFATWSKLFRVDEVIETHGPWHVGRIKCMKVLLLSSRWWWWWWSTPQNTWQIIERNPFFPASRHPNSIFGSPDLPQAVWLPEQGGVWCESRWHGSKTCGMLGGFARHLWFEVWRGPQQNNQWGGHLSNEKRLYILPSYKDPY